MCESFFIIYRSPKPLVIIVINKVQVVMLLEHAHLTDVIYSLYE